MAGREMRWFGGKGQAKGSRSKAAFRGKRCSLENLEARQLLHGASIDVTQLQSLVPDRTGPAAYVSTAMAAAAGSAQAGDAAGSLASYGSGGFGRTSAVSSTSTKLLKTPDPRTLDQQMGLPLLDSNPGAPATLYLDFDGNFDPDWWQYDNNGKEVHFSNVTTPVFDTDGNAASFSASEQALVSEIWSRVAEDYAPFNINVSTDYYGDFQDGKALHVVIGGNNSDWLHQDASGISSIGSFSDGAPNEVFVFNLMTWATAGVKDADGRVMNGPAAIANTASHEAGHAFGLRHHALYSASGTKLTDYNPGTSDWTPIMGDNKASDRTTWFAGPNDQGAQTWQDDMAILAGSKNGFGWKADDHSSSLSAADTLSPGLKIGTLAASGIINNTNDIDTFQFTTGGSPVQITVSSAHYGPNLIPLEALCASSGDIVARASYFSSTQSIISTTLPAGTYYIMVISYGDYGDVGQYAVSVSFDPVLNLGSLQISPTTTTTTTSSGSTSQNSLLASTTSTAPATSSSALGSGGYTTPMEAQPATPLASAKQASREDLLDELFAQESFVDELGDLAGVRGRA
jgi:hypothetical protein